jgi:putative flippase GtrA
VLTSLFTTALDFAALVGLTELAGVNYVLATWIGTVVGSLANFTINKVWAFSAGHVPTGPAFGRFLLVQAGSSGLQTLGVWLITRFGQLPYPASKAIVAAAVYLTWNYPLNRWFIFRVKAPSRAPSSEAATSPLRE